MIRNLLFALAIAVLPAISLAAVPTYVELVRNTTTSTSPMTLTIPSGWNTGDLVIAFIYTSTRTISSTSGGWTLLTSETSGSDDVYAYWKIMDSGDANESQTWTLSANPSSGFVAYFRITGHDPTTPINTSNHALDASSGTSHVSPSVTTTVDNCLILRSALLGGQTFTASSGDTGTQINNDGTTNYALFQSSKVSNGSTGTATYTTGSSRQLPHMVFAIAPSPSTTRRPNLNGNFQNLNGNFQ